MELWLAALICLSALVGVFLASRAKKGRGRTAALVILILLALAAAVYLALAWTLLNAIP